MASSSSAPVEIIPDGTVLHRVHHKARGAEYYGRRDATWRYDAPDGAFGVLYLGLSLGGPFAETLLRYPHETELLWSEIDKRCRATFKATRTLRLAPVRGRGLSYFGVAADEVRAASDPAKKGLGYAKTQAIAARIYGDPAGFDGVAYLSRYNDEVCFALFDRASDGVSLIGEHIPFDRDEVRGLLAGTGIQLLDL